MLQYVCTYFIWKQYIYRIVLKIIYSDTFPAIRLCRYFVLFRYLHQSFDVVRFFVPRASCDVWYAYCYASPLGSQVYWWVQYWWMHVVNHNILHSGVALTSLHIKSYLTPQLIRRFSAISVLYRYRMLDALLRKIIILLLPVTTLVLCINNISALSHYRCAKNQQKTAIMIQYPLLQLGETLF